MVTYKTNVDELKLKRIASDIPRAQIRSSQDASDYSRRFYFDDLEIYESFFIILLNRGNNTTGFVKISQGGITGTVVDVRLIAKFAIESLASGVILIHNHPSGNTNPSDEDKRITQKTKQALTLFDISLLDHIILTSSKHFSFADEGIL